MGITRIKSQKKNKGETILIVVDGKKLKLSDADLKTHNTIAKMKTELTRQKGKVLGNVFFHKNRDGSFAIATGAAPDIWPEDEING